MSFSCRAQLAPLLGQLGLLQNARMCPLLKISPVVVRAECWYRPVSSAGLPTAREVSQFSRVDSGFNIVSLASGASSLSCVEHRQAHHSPFLIQAALGGLSLMPRSRKINLAWSGVVKKIAQPFKSDHFCSWSRSMFLPAMKKELSPKQILAVHCPTCGAAPGEKCKLTTGRHRAESHRDRRLIAAEQLVS